MDKWYYIWTAVFWVVLVAYFGMAGFVAVFGYRDIRRLFSKLDAEVNEDANDSTG